MLRRDDWNHYTYVYGEGQPACVAFDVQAAVTPMEGGQGVRVISDEADEAGLLAVLEPIEGVLVGRLTYGGRVELVVQVPQVPASLQAALEALGATFEITEGWAYFDQRVCPTPKDWRRIEDREALERLDLDGDGELRVLHRFYGGVEGLEAIGARLTPEGFNEVHREPERLTLDHIHPISDISRITVGLLRLCEKHGVAYDGWVLPG